MDKNEPNCLTAFNNPYFLYHLLHKEFTEQSLASKPLQSVIPYFSSFTDNNHFTTFLTWQSPLRLPQDIQRQKERNILENYCAATKNTAQDIQLHNIEDNAIYAETDWIFPQNRP